jgi:phage tail sheath gpL-like
MQDGMLMTALRGTEGTLTTWLNTRNSPHVTTITTTKDATSPWQTAAMAGAALESSAAIDPAAPPRAVLVGYRGPAQGNHFTIDQMNNLFVKGGSSLEIAPDSTGALLRMVQNYKLSAGGAPDRSMAETMWLKTMSYYRWFRVTEFQTKYHSQGYKLAQYITDPIPGQKIMTVDLAQEIMVGLYKLFCDAGLCQNPGYYAKTLLAEIDAPNGKLKIIDEPVIVTQHYQTEITSSVIAGQV